MFTAIEPTAGKRRRTYASVSGTTNEDATIDVMAFPSGLQWFAVAWSDEALRGIVFGHSIRRQAESAIMRAHRLPQAGCRIVSEEAIDAGQGPGWLRPLIDGLRRFADGEPVEFADVPIAEDHLTPFSRRVVAACRWIEWGQVTSYGELAARCGAPGAARAVGSVMAKNRFPLVVPCHRVLGAGGRLGGYSAPGGLRTKRRLLDMEAGS